MKKRRRILVVPGIQHKLLKSSIFIFLGTILVLFTLLMFTFAQIESVLQRAPDGDALLILIKEVESQVTWIFSMMTVVGLGFIYYYGIKISHKIAGPFYRIQTHFREINENKHCSPIKFRDADLVGDLATTINEHISNYRNLSDPQKGADSQDA